MPVLPGQVPSEEPKRASLPDDVYSVEVEDIEFESKPNTFPDAQPGSVIEQYLVKFKVVSPAEFAGRSLRTWISPRLWISTKSTSPSLVALLKAISGTTWTEADREKLTPEFMNSLIGSKLRVSVVSEANKQGNEFPKIKSFLPDRS